MLSSAAYSLFVICWLLLNDWFGHFRDGFDKVISIILMVL
jgi:hypothetical protein